MIEYFVKYTEVLQWLLFECEEEFPIITFEIEFEGCMWIPLRYFTDTLFEVKTFLDRVRIYSQEEINNMI